MPAAFGYTTGQTQEVLEQARRVENYVNDHLTGVVWGGLFEDGPEYRRRPFGQRPGAFRLLTRLQRGDHLVLAGLSTAFPNWADFLDTCQALEVRGVTLHLLDPTVNGASSEGRAGLTLLRRFAEIDRQRRGAQARENNARRKAAGKPINGNPPYGFKYTGPRRHRRPVPDSYTRAIGRLIVKWRLDGHSLDTIYYHLLAHRVRTRDGREWSRGSIQRAFYGECRLQAQEEPQKQPRSRDRG
jgi:DNA invertase Pin-like site-specific DNA recombinase